uniref:ribonuclease H n=1 Tax=Kryptolebias marmoratus TaxID=37003 RepID=A0A3Q2ZPZ1_KRYMA
QTDRRSHSELGRHDSMINALCKKQQSETSHLDQLTLLTQEIHQKLSSLVPTTADSTSVSASAATSLPVSTSGHFREVPSPTPEPFLGEIGKCAGFLLQCYLVFARSPQSFTDGLAKIAYIVGLLRDKALKWAEAKYSFRKLWNLKQGSRSVAQFAIDFRTLALTSGWNEAALKGVFIHSLQEPLKDQLAGWEEPRALDDLITLAIRLDNRLWERQRERRDRTTNLGRHVATTEAESTIPTVEQEPMQVGRARLTAEERLRRLEAKECFYCGEGDHFRARCPHSLTQPLGSRFFVHATLLNHQIKVPVRALINSGAEQSLISRDLVTRLQLKPTPLASPLPVLDISGQVITRITHKVAKLQFLVSGNHRQESDFLVFSAPNTQMILGFPWLQLHNPVINWTERRIESWSPFCLQNCLHSALPSSSTKTEPEQAPDLTKIPVEYHHLAPVFSKAKALSLPPHRPYDCAIELVPGETLPSSRLFNLSRPERDAMKSYIEDSLASGIIRPFMSPLGAGFFFVQKKDKSLRPCIEYRGLNQITVKNKYPLPLIDSVHQQLHSATVFTKLDLRNAYHLVRIREGDEWKTAFKTPLGHFEYLVMFLPRHDYGSEGLLTWIITDTYLAANWLFFFWNNWNRSAPPRCRNPPLGPVSKQRDIVILATIWKTELYPRLTRFSFSCRLLQKLTTVHSFTCK